MKKIVLIIRRDREYYLEGKVVNYVARMQYFWGFLYKLPYVEFKKRLAEIASLTYFANKFDRIYFWGEFEEVNKEDHIVVAVDEDDWISASLTEELRKFDFQGKPVIKWQALNLRCDKDPAFRLLQWSDTPSCAYAIKAPYKARSIGSSDNMMECKDSDTIKLHQILSVKIDNFASVSFMQTQTGNTLLKYMRDGYLVEKVAPLQEYEQQVDLYNDLLKELYDSCKV